MQTRKDFEICKNVMNAMFESLLLITMFDVWIIESQRLLFKSSLIRLSIMRKGIFVNPQF